MALLVVKLRRVLEEGSEVGGAALLGNLRQVRGVIGALTEQRVTVDAVVIVPDILATGDLRGDLLGIGQCGKLPVTVDRHAKEHHRSDGRRYQRERACLTFVHCELSIRRCRSNR